MTILKEIPRKYIDLAEENDINYGLLWQRVNKLGWSLREAATVPVQHRTVSQPKPKLSTIEQLSYLIQNSRDRKSSVECRADFIERLKVQFAADPEVMKYLSSIKA